MIYEHLFSPMIISNQIIKNRIVMAPMATGFASNSGEVTDRSIAYYQARARGGVGMIIVEAACVDSSVGRESMGQICIDGPRYISGLARLAGAIQSYNTRAFIQLFHSGRQTSTVLTHGSPPVAPSPIPCPTMRIMPRELTGEEVEQIRDRFIDAAGYAERAGFDGVELHAAHGYLINQFFSPHSNVRSDNYGGSFENRIRFLMEIISGIHKSSPRLMISVRLNLDDFIEDGLHLEEGLLICTELEKAGIDIIHVSCGTYQSGLKSIEPSSYTEGWRMYLAEAVKKTVSTPVIGGGMIRDPAYAEECLAKGKADMIFLGRPLLADPEWANKLLNNQQEFIKPCIVCNQCIENNFNGHSVSCTVNARTGREMEPMGVSRISPGKSAVVVGSGPAGMQAALSLQRMRVKVTIFEKDMVPGGLLNLASLPPYKHRIRHFQEYLLRCIRQARIDLVLGTPYTADQLGLDKPDYVVLATGSQPILPYEWMKTADHYGYGLGRILNGSELPPGKDVIVIGGGISGCEAADHLAVHHKNVVLVEQQPSLAVKMEKKNRRDLLNRLNAAGVGLMPGHRVVSVDSHLVKVEDMRGEVRELESDYIVYALGYEPDRSLYDQMRVIHPHVHLIGDAFQIGGIRAAVLQGTRVAEQLQGEVW